MTWVKPLAEAVVDLMIMQVVAIVNYARRYDYTDCLDKVGEGDCEEADGSSQGY